MKKNFYMDTYLSYEGLKEKDVNSPCQSDDKENVETNISAEEPFWRTSTIDNSLKSLLIDSFVGDPFGLYIR